MQDKVTITRDSIPVDTGKPVVTSVNRLIDKKVIMLYVLTKLGLSAHGLV
jgi:hypothetical protein